MSGPSLAIHSRASAAQRLERLEQHVEALALLVAAAEEDRRVRRRRRHRGTDLVDLDAVEEDLVLAAGIAAWTSSRASFDTTTLRSMRWRCRTARTSRRSGSSTPRRRRGTCRRPARGASGPTSCVGPGASGSWMWRTSNSSSLRARMVRIAAEASGASRGDRAVGRRRQAVAERRHERLRRRPVARPQHPDLVALAAQLAGQTRGPGSARRPATTSCTGRPARSAASARMGAAPGAR